MEKENYQVEARLRELKGRLARLNLEEDKVRLRTDELKREETEAGALLGRQFWAICPCQGETLTWAG